MQSQIDFWNAVADAKAFSHPFDLAQFSRLVPHGARILDYGCGYGRVTAELYANGYTNIVGVDSATRMIERARADHPQIAFTVLEAPWLPFADASFDAVLLFSVLTCMPNDDGQRAMIGDIARVLRPGGVFYVSDLLLQDDERNRARYDARVRLKADATDCGLNADAVDRDLNADAVDRSVRLQPDLPYGVFEIEPNVMFRHHSRSWLDDLLGGFERIAFVELPVITMNGNAARGFQFFGTRR